jgi:hypothetical protein
MGMKTKIILMIAALLSVVNTACTQTNLSQIEGSLKDMAHASGFSQNLPESRIVQGLKEALSIGTSNAVTSLSRAGGYFDNPEIRIPLPKAVEDAQDLLRTAGLGDQLDAFEMSINRAAEKAAPKAKGIFWDAITKMTVSDAQGILAGREDEATLYFKEKTYDNLSQAFKPLIHEAMAQVGVTRWFQQLNDTMGLIPFAEKFRLDLDQYVNDKALDGLFFMLAKEEKKIRQDPAARVTAILIEVFR